MRHTKFKGGNRRTNGVFGYMNGYQFRIGLRGIPTTRMGWFRLERSVYHNELMLQKYENGRSRCSPFRMKVL